MLRSPQRVCKFLLDGVRDVALAGTGGQRSDGDILVVVLDPEVDPNLYILKKRQ